ncbi:hypothetical protein N0V85_006971 [Neurospora sp. IMI 360204]|nr:hypothetical protein N0V85_006971 [Neurospora sp. IMI 360204]
MNKRTKTEPETAGGSMTVYTKGPYTIRITEGGTPNAEFTSNVPATVQVKIVPGSATNADVKADSNDDGSDD